MQRKIAIPAVLLVGCWLYCLSNKIFVFVYLADEIRICLSPVPGQPSDSSYISAATVDVRC